TGDDGRVGILDAADPAQHLDDRVERDSPAEGHRARLDPHGPIADQPPELAQEPRLADTRLAPDEEHLPRAGPHLLEALAEQPELTLSSDEAGTADLALGVAHEAVGWRALRLSAQRLQLEVPAERDGSGRADDDMARVGVRHQRLEHLHRPSLAISLDDHLAV